MKLEIYLEYSCSGESVTYNTIPKYSINTFRGGCIGSWLIEIINMDYSKVSQIVEEYFVDCAFHTKKFCLDDIFFDFRSDRFTPSNCEDVYRKLVAAAPVIGCFYPPSDWFSIIYDFYGEGTHSPSNAYLDKEEFIAFLNALNQKPEFLNYDFLEFLNRHDFLPPVSVAAPSVEYVDNIRLKLPRQKMGIDKFLDFAHNEFTATQSESRGKKYVYHFNQNSRVSAILVSSLLELTRNGKIVKKCSNCGKYFIPKNRSDTLYCDSVSPQDPSLTCMQYGSQRLWYARQKDDELATLSRNILSAKSMLAKRNPDIREYTISYDYFREERKKWKKAVEKGDIRREEYKEWLILMQGQKVIKEAINGNSRKDPE